MRANGRPSALATSLPAGARQTGVRDMRSHTGVHDADANFYPPADRLKSYSYARAQVLPTCIALNCARLVPPCHCAQPRSTGVPLSNSCLSDIGLRSTALSEGVS